ncbi:MAG: lysophospholipid acyltransferase family protein [Desulfarculus sp.]|nr:lysophospholipid acyltransferase family protein [Desulfarculus sp.]
MGQEQRFSLGQRIVFWLSTNLAGRLLGLLMRTCRVEILSPREEQRYLKEGHPAIAATWHRGAIFFLYFFGHLRPAIMVSRSKDGEFLARFIAHYGGVPVRGSSSKGGGLALKTMVEMVKSGQVRFAATVADGPRGPRYRAKAGMILLAMQTGLPLLPIMWSADRAWVLTKTWDHTIIPKPFAKIKVACGRELRYPAHLDKEEMEAARQELERELNRLKDQLDGLCGLREPD